MLRTDDRDAVRTLTFDRPERRNAFDDAAYRGLAAALAEARADETVHVVVLTGAGTAFSAGQDLAEMAAMIQGEVSFPDGYGFEHLLEQLEEFDKPLLAAVNGPAAGVGLTMLLHCDLVLVAEGARLRVPFAELGVPPEAGSSVLLPSRIGWQHAAELLFTSRWLSGAEAATCGLALRCVPDEQLLDEAATLARSIAQHPPLATRTAKRLLLDGRGDAARAARARENAAFVAVFADRRADR